MGQSLNPTIPKIRIETATFARMPSSETLVGFVVTLILRMGLKMTKLTDYVKIADAARIVGVSQNTLRHWAESGKMPVRRNPANGYRLFRKKDLEAFLGRVESGEKAKRKPKG